MAFLFPLSLVFLDLMFFFAFLLNAFLFTVLSFLPLNVIFLILLSPINALELIVLTAFPITTVSSFEQFLNVFFPINSYLVTYCKLLQGPCSRQTHCYQLLLHLIYIPYNLLCPEL